MSLDWGELTNDLDKNIWMLQAFIGKEALEDDDALDEDEDEGKSRS